MLANLYFFLKVAAVVVGVVVGGLTGRILAGVIGSRRARLPLVAGGAALGGLVLWLAVTHVGGGGGFGLGGGAGLGSGASTATGQSPERPPPRDTAKEKNQRHVRIALLGGKRVRDQRFYIVDKDPPRSWDELLEVLAERRRQPGGLKSIDIVIYLDSVDKDTPAVQDLVQWAKDNKLQFTMSFPQEDAP
jgi:hypothetical protein